MMFNNVFKLMFHKTCEVEEKVSSRELVKAIYISEADTCHINMQISRYTQRKTTY